MIKIAHFGTFDVDNYGDLLFPHIAEYRLRKYYWEHISPTENSTIFKDAKKIISFENAVNNKYDAVIIGGGNIIHLLPNNQTVYNNLRGFEYANLWVGAAKLATHQKIPYVFNAPGISKSFQEFLHKKIAAATFNNASYLAFREIFSKQMAIDVFRGTYQGVKKNIAIVPDTAFDIDRMWPIEQARDFDYIVVNVNSRYHEPARETAFNLDKISKELKMPIKFVLIGDCHGDKEFTTKVSQEMKEKHQISNINSLKETAHLIANATYFFGSSMHAFITALAYGVPAFLVLNLKPIHKFLGLLEVAELDRNVICTSFKDSYKKLKYPAKLTQNVKLKIQTSLDNHWKKIDDVVTKQEKSKRSIYISNYEKLLIFNIIYRKISKF